MNLDDILNGSRVFVDASIILYLLARKSVQCRTFLTRCDAHGIEGWISTAVVAEIAHRRMIHEAQFQQLVASDPARMLAQKQDLVCQLGAYADDVRNLLGGGLEVEMIRPDDFYPALELQKQHGLLTNDALNLSVAKRLGIKEIATAHANFDHIQGLIVYKPEDLI